MARAGIILLANRVATTQRQPENLIYPFSGCLCFARLSHIYFQAAHRNNRQPENHLSITETSLQTSSQTPS
nr:hypothetical protein [uncultured Kingella sp.]